MGREQIARERFTRLLDLRNDVGLLAEEYDPRTRRMLGNFPQALSHVALVNSARNLASSGGPSEHRAGASPRGHRARRPATQPGNDASRAGVPAIPSPACAPRSRDHQPARDSQPSLISACRLAGQ